MNRFVITITPDHDGEPGGAAQTTVRVDTSSGQTRITELTVRAADNTGLAQSDLPAVDLDLLVRALAPQPAGPARLTAGPAASPQDARPAHDAPPAEEPMGRGTPTTATPGADAQAERAGDLRHSGPTGPAGGAPVDAVEPPAVAEPPAVVEEPAVPEPSAAVEPAAVGESPAVEPPVKASTAKASTAKATGRRASARPAAKKATGARAGKATAVKATGRKAGGTKTTADGPGTGGTAGRKATAGKAGRAKAAAGKATAGRAGRAAKAAPEKPVKKTAAKKAGPAGSTARTTVRKASAKPPARPAGKVARTGKTGQDGAAGRAATPSGRPYRRMPEATEVLAAYAQIGTISGLADAFGVPRHTASAWARRLRQQGHSIGRS